MKKNQYKLIAYDFSGKIVAEKIHFGTYSSEIRGFNQMQRNLSKAMNEFRRENCAKIVISKFEGN